MYIISYSGAVAQTEGRGSSIEAFKYNESNSYTGDTKNGEG